MTTLSVVIPAYNEEEGIADIVNRVLAVGPSLKDVGVDHLELLVVDDGSKDRTAEIVNGIAGVRLIQHVKNRGYGGALKNGFSQASGELIGFLDADGTYPPEYFPKLCKEAMNGCDLVIGSRMAGADSQMPVTRRVGNFFFANLLIAGGPPEGDRQRQRDARLQEEDPEPALPSAGWVEPDPGDEHPRASRRDQNFRSANSVQRKGGALETERCAGWVSLPAVHALDGAVL